MTARVLLDLVLVFAPLSLVAVGGVMVVLPDIHRQVVEVHGWLTDAQFADLFALARAAPGPNVLLVSLIGWQAAGWAGAVVATLAMCGPSAVLAYVAARLWRRFRDAPWRRPVQAGMVPISAGLVLATAVVVAGAVETTPLGYVLTALTVLLVLRTRLHPLLLMAGAAALALAGWL